MRLVLSPGISQVISRTYMYVHVVYHYYIGFRTCNKLYVCGQYFKVDDYVMIWRKRLSSLSFENIREASITEYLRIPPKSHISLKFEFVQVTWFLVRWVYYIHRSYRSVGQLIHMHTLMMPLIVWSILRSAAVVRHASSKSGYIHHNNTYTPSLQNHCGYCEVSSVIHLPQRNDE